MTSIMNCHDSSCYLVRSDLSNLGSITAELLNDLSTPATKVSQICKVHATNPTIYAGLCMGDRYDMIGRSP